MKHKKQNSMFRTKPYSSPSQSTSESGYTFFNVFFLGISCVIGTGIYFAPVTSFSVAGSASILALFINGILCVSVALPFAELSTRVQGFCYEYIYSTCGELLALFYTFGIILVNIFVTAITAQLWSSFFVQLLGLNINSKYVEFLPIVAVTVTVLTGRKSSAIFSNISTIINIANAFLAAVLLWTQPGFSFPGDKLWSGLGSVEKAKMAFPIWFFTLLGFENVGAIARNARNASRTIPISMIGPLLLAIGLNLAILVGVMGQSVDVSKDSILDVIQWGELRGLMTFGALFGVTSALLWIVLLQGEMIQTLSRDGLIPSVLNKRSVTDVPYVATLLHMVSSIICCYTGSISSLITTLGWTIIGMPMGCLGLIFIRYDDSKDGSKQLGVLKKYGLLFAITFIGLGVLDAFPQFIFLNSWGFRGAIAILAMGGFVYLCRKSKMTCEASPVPCIGFPYVPLFGAMSFFFVVGYTMNFGSFLTILAVSILVYFGYSRTHSKLSGVVIDARDIKYAPA